jgi:sulfate adenylyltransferase large subunit
MDTVKFVIVGHVDHGKSTLIGRTLFDTNSLPPDRIAEMKKVSDSMSKETEFAYLLDHLEEERRQGITIDTTQVFFKTDKRHYVIIDAPGHVEFVKNMVTGASQSEAAVLILDVKEGVKEQTRRHAYILSMLGIKQVIAVLNKMDLVDFSKDRYKEVKTALERFLKSIQINPLHYIPVSALKGDNVKEKSAKMGWYDGPAFLESLDKLEGKETAQDKPLVLPVQDVYKFDEKRIAAGRVESGCVETGDRIKILPEGTEATVASVEKYREETESASAGECTGVVTKEPVFINRGNVICSPENVPEVTDTVYANIFWLSKKECNREERLSIRCATQETTCRISEIKKKIDSSTLEITGEDASTIKNLEAAQVVIKTKTPLVIKSFSDLQELGRFVLIRDNNTCAGGIITGREP